jgi:hypothetical protein
VTNRELLETMANAVMGERIHAGLHPDVVLRALARAVLTLRDGEQRCGGRACRDEVTPAA